MGVKGKPTWGETMRKRAFAVFACLLLAAIALGAATGSADAKPKKWVKVIAMSGGEDHYTGQYDSHAFRLRGGRQKFVASLVPMERISPEDADWWALGWYFKRLPSHDTRAYFEMVNFEGDVDAPRRAYGFLRLSKGRYRIEHNTVNCTWEYTLWEKR